MVFEANATAAFFRRSQAQMVDLRASAEALQGQIATGERLQRSSDDPVASARLRTLARTERLSAIESDNAQRASQELGAASARLEDIANALIRVRELALQAGSESVSDAVRQSIADEVAQLRESILASANATSLSGRALFGGEQGGPAYSVDGAGNETYVGTASSGALEIGAGVSVERGLTGPAVFQFTLGGGSSDVFAYLRDLENGLRLAPDPAGFARDAIAGLDSAIATIGKAQTVIGVRMGWIETVQDSEIARGTDRAEERNALGAVDLASAISQMQQVLTVLEASQASFARLASLSLFDRL